MKARTEPPFWPLRGCLPYRCWRDAHRELSLMCTLRTDDGSWQAVAFHLESDVPGLTFASTHHFHHGCLQGCSSDVGCWSRWFHHAARRNSTHPLRARTSIVYGHGLTAWRTQISLVVGSVLTQRKARTARWHVDRAGAYSQIHDIPRKRSVLSEESGETPG